MLLDVSSLTYRAFFSMPDTVTSPDGRPVNAVYGYLDMVCEKWHKVFEEWRQLILSRPDSAQDWEVALAKHQPRTVWTRDETTQPVLALLTMDALCDESTR